MRTVYHAAVLSACLLGSIALDRHPARAQSESARDAESDAGDETGLRALSPDGTKLGACPLEHTDVDIEVSGFVERTRVTQRFQNPHDERIEAVYTFPLPEKAAVRAMQMRIGDRVVKAEIRRREAAREEYEAAKKQGKTASLLDQERPNIFTQSVANIRPGHPVEVTLEYVRTLPYEDGHYELSFPMTVGPRYIPGRPTGQKGTGWSPDTDRVSDASRITPPVAPEGRSGHDLSLNVKLDAGVNMGKPASPSHDLVVDRKGPRRAHVRLKTQGAIPNRDLILRWPVSPRKVGSAALTHRNDRSRPGYLTLMLQPNADPPEAEITPKEIVFVLDTSGSMHGEPMDMSKELMRRMLRNLHPDDTFSVLRYSDRASGLSVLPLKNTKPNVQKALKYVDSLSGSGGTNALAGVRTAFAYPHERDRLRIVVFMTDGYIGNEAEILSEIEGNIGDSRLFSFGIGSSVNRYLLEEMARIGRGDAQIVTLKEEPEKKVASFFRRMQSPYLTDIRIDWGNLPVRARFPKRIPDLFAGQPLQVHARYGGSGPRRGRVTVRGKLAGDVYEKQIDVRLPAHNPRNEAIASVWARQRIASLSRDMHAERFENEPVEPLEEKITRVALDHSLTSKYTSFLAVEHRVVTKTEGGEPRTVTVPAEKPEGVSTERIFGGESSLSLARFQPGDPELRVDVPPTARQVTAIFPFGESEELHWDARKGQWTCRFLVPRGTPEGNYTITILVTHEDGRQERIRQPYTVDSSGPEVAVELLDEVRPGADVRIEAVQHFTEAARALHGANPRVEIRSDVARVRVRTPAGKTVTLSRVEPGVWRGRWHVPSGASLEGASLDVSAYDMAGNRGEQTVSLAEEE